MSAMVRLFLWIRWKCMEEQNQRISFVSCHFHQTWQSSQLNQCTPTSGHTTEVQETVPKLSLSHELVRHWLRPLYAWTKARSQKWGHHRVILPCHHSIQKYSSIRSVGQRQKRSNQMRQHGPSNRSIWLSRRDNYVHSSTIQPLIISAVHPAMPHCSVTCSSTQSLPTAITKALQNRWTMEKPPWSHLDFSSGSFIPSFTSFCQRYKSKNEVWPLPPHLLLPLQQRCDYNIWLRQSDLP